MEEALKPTLSFDVFVLGAGSAGTALAYTCARQGLKTLVAEKHGFCGGTLSASLVSPMLSFHAGRRQIVFGFAEKLIQRLQKRKGSTGHLPDPLGFAPSLTPIEGELIKLEQEALCLEAGVTFFYHAHLDRVQVEENRDGKEITAIWLSHKGGEVKVSAAFFVDASGDADLCALAGAKLQKNEGVQKLQPLTTFFKVSHVDIQKLTAYMAAHRNDFVLRPDFDRITYPGTKMIYPGVCGFFSKMARAKKEGRFPLQRDRVLLFGGVQPGDVSVNMTRVSRNALDGWELSQAEQEGRRQVEICFDFLKKEIPGFEKATLAQLPSSIGVRESRRVAGLYTLTGKDVLSCRKFEDGIARSAYPIDIHPAHSDRLITRRLPEGEFYEIPLRCLIVKGFLNLGVAGRCASFTHAAQASARVSAQCMAMGEGLGYALVLARKLGKALPEIPFEQVKQRVQEEEKAFDPQPLRI